MRLPSINQVRLCRASQATLGFTQHEPITAVFEFGMIHDERFPEFERRLDEAFRKAGIRYTMHWSKNSGIDPDKLDYMYGAGEDRELEGGEAGRVRRRRVADASCSRPTRWCAPGWPDRLTLHVRGGRSMFVRRSAIVLVAVLVLLAGASTARAQGLGPNVTIFDPSMPVAEIQAKVDAIHAQQVDDEMGTNRYALLFKPGVYGTAEQPLQMKVGYYTEVAGLGASPADVTINGKIEVYNRCLADGGTSNCLALVNFWRSLSNLTLNINPAGQDGCRSTANFYAVSQASSIRRISVAGGTFSLMDYCTAGPQFASGGFIADSKLPTVLNGSQQQWLTRNSEIATWTNGVWNQVFAGVTGAPSEATFPTPPYTTLATTPVSREKPYLFVDSRGKYQRPRARGAAGHERRWPRPPGPHDPAPRLLRRHSVGLGKGHRPRARPRPAPAADAGGLQRRPQPVGQARRHGRARDRAGHADRGPRRGAADRRRRPRRHRRGRDH